MIKLFVRWFVRDYEKVEEHAVRESYAVLGGILGIACNLFLFGLKLTIGLLMNSIAIMSDAFNNLSDMGSSLIAIIGAKISNREPDKEHPFGHGRVEYISALIVSFIIIIVGFELLKNSFDKIIHYEKISFNLTLVIILTLSMLVKVWMFSYNRYLGRKIDSSVLLATATDSINDVYATGAVVLSTIIGYFVNFPIDGIIGLGVSLLIMYTGYRIAMDTISSLLGTPPSKEMVDQITSKILSGEGIVGMHDLVVHEYGPGRVMASVHAEVPDTIDINQIHGVIDETEQSILNELGIHIVIHMDPISVSCEKTEQTKKLVKEVISQMDDRLSIHDFRMTESESRINLIFDLAVPYTMKQKERDSLTARIAQCLAEEDSRYHTAIQVDNVY